MIGKKINQLATELAPASTDLTIIGNPTTGVSKKITLEQLGAIFSGAVSFYTNLAAFPNPGTINVIYCAKDTKKLYLWSGTAYVEVFPSQALLDTYQLRSEKGVSNGYASLDSGGKVPISQLPSSIMEYKGTWNAATNTPTLANGTGDTGDVYICNVAGTVNFGAGPITFAVGDYTIYSGTIWQRSSGAVGTVTSVGITETGDALTITGSPITTSGTINIGFAGANTQYVRGDGTLATFPSIISQAQNLVTEVYNSTGATLTKGTVVYINGGQGNLPTITKALATGDSTSAQTYGIVQNDITNNNNGFVVAAGRLSDLDTQAFTEGTQLYLSSTTAGAYTSTKQYAPAHLVYVAIVVRAHPTQGVIEVKIQNGFEMDELHNVSAQSPSNNDGLFYNTSTSLWEKKSIATVLGYTPANAATYVPYTGATTSVNLGTNNITAQNNILNGNGTDTGSYLAFKQYSGSNSGADGYTSLYALAQNSLYIRYSQADLSQKNVDLSAALLGTTTRQYLFPDKNGTFAMTSDIPSLAAYVTLGTYQVITENKKFTLGLSLGSAGGINQESLFVNSNNLYTGSAGSNVFGFNNTNNIFFGKGASNGGVLAWNNSIVRFYDLPDEDGTIALVGGSGVGSVTSVAALTIGTTGTDLSSTVANGTTTPVITLNVPTASATNRGALSSADWTTFNNKTSNTGTVTSVGLSSATSGVTIGSTPITTSGTITLAIATASGSQQGLLSSTDWTTFNSKQNALTNPVTGTGTTNYLPKFTGASTIGNSVIQEVSGNILIGNNTASATTTPVYLSTGGTYGTTLANGIKIKLFESGIVSHGIGVISGNLYLNTTDSTTYITLNTNNTERLRIDTSGNLGLGVTPSAWNGAYKVLQVGNRTSLVYANAGASYLGTNWYVSTGGFNTYIENSAATLYGQSAGQHQWFNAPSGTAGNAITFTQTMTLDASGNLLLGTTSNTYSSRLAVIGSGNGFFELGQGTSSTLFQSNGQDFYLNLKGTGNIIFRNGSGDTERFRIASTGNVGIGTTSPSSILEIREGNRTNGSNITNFGVYTTTTQSTDVGGTIGLGGLFNGSAIAPFGSIRGGKENSTSGNYAGYLAFQTIANNVSLAERMRITSDGNVGIGTTSPSDKLDVAGSIRVSSNNFFRYDGDTGLIGSATSIAGGANTQLGIRAASDILFATNGANERMRITSGGSLLVGGTANDFGSRQVNTSATSYTLHSARTGTGSEGHLVFSNANGAVGSIFTNASVTSYNVTSDYRLKEDYKDYSGLDLVSKIKTYDYAWKIDGQRMYGVIAHELQSVINYAVTGVKDGKDMQQVDYSKIVPVLIKAIQEQQLQINTLKNK
jgi:hypothetical protein